MLWGKNTAAAVFELKGSIESIFSLSRFHFAGSGWLGICGASQEIIALNNNKEFIHAIDNGVRQ